MEDAFDGKMMGDAWTIVAEKIGYEIAPRVSMGLGGKDFTKAKAGNLDAILSLSNVPDAATLVRRTKEHRFNETIEARSFHIEQTQF